MNLWDKPTDEQKEYHSVTDARLPLACRNNPQLASLLGHLADRVLSQRKLEIVRAKL